MGVSKNYKGYDILNLRILARVERSGTRHGEGCVEPADPPIIQDSFSKPVGQALPDNGLVHGAVLCEAAAKRPKNLLLCIEIDSSHSVMIS